MTIRKTPENTQSTKVDTHEKVETGKESCAKFEEQKKLTPETDQTEEAKHRQSEVSQQKEDKLEQELEKEVNKKNRPKDKSTCLLEPDNFNDMMED